MSFKIELRALNLNLIEHLVTQKCLLPKHKWPGDWLPGSTVKCVFVNNYCSICHIYARPFPPKDNCCYLDSCVTFGDIDLESMELKELVLLSEVKVTSINISLEVNEPQFIEYLEKSNGDNIKTIIAATLKSLWLTPICTVKHKAFNVCGVRAVHIQAIGSYATNVYFCLEEDVTKLNIVDTRIPSLANLPKFYNIGFEAARRRLKNLLEISRKQTGIAGKLANNVLIVGPNGCGKTSLMCAFLKKHNFNCFFVNTTNLFGQYPGETEAELRRVFMLAYNFVNKCNPRSPTAVIIEDLHLLCPAKSINKSSSGFYASTQLLALLNQLNTAKKNVICIATTTSADKISEVARRPGRFHNEIKISMPTKEHRMKFFDELFKDKCPMPEFKNAITQEILEFVGDNTRGFLMADIVLAVHRILKELQEEPTSDLMNVVTEILQNINPEANRVNEITVMKSDCGFESLGGMPLLKRMLMVSIIGLLKQKDAYRRFGLHIPKGILLYGPPGCGKTLVAKCLAYEANMSFISTTPAEVYSPYVGCAEKFITQIFDTARKNVPCMVFFDEIDALVGRRCVNSRIADDVQIRVLSTLLTEMDGIVTSEGADIDHHILVVGATNRPDMVDEALLRFGRFDKLIHVSAPDLISRRIIFGMCTRNMSLAYNVDLDYLAMRTEQFSGADICNLCNEAALQSLVTNFDSVEVTRDSFEIVLHSFKSSLTAGQLRWYYEFEKKHSI